MFTIFGEGSSFRKHLLALKHSKHFETLSGHLNTVSTPEIGALYTETGVPIAGGAPAVLKSELENSNGDSIISNLHWGNMAEMADPLNVKSERLEFTEQFWVFIPSLFSCFYPVSYTHLTLPTILLV